MKRLSVVILAMLVVLVAVVTGCSRVPHYDSRLAAADSLMRTLPDSTLALVEAVSPDSLSSEGDRAYRDLLLTQARYRCYIVATSDSTINRALNYYSNHSNEREKLTRAYIYKGAVMEELGHPDSAMFYYKTAEAAADLKDYANLGQINTRIADLYRRYYGDDQTCFEKYHKALKYYLLTGNKPLQANSLYNMAMFAGITCHVDSDKYLNQAISLAVEINDSLQLYDCYELQCRLLSLQDSTRRRAKQIGLKCLNDLSGYVDVDLMLDLSHINALEHQVDSAIYYLRYLGDQSHYQNLSLQQQLRLYGILSLVADNEGKKILYHAYRDSIQKINDSISNNKIKYFLQEIENAGNQQLHREMARQKSQYAHLLWAVIAVFMLFLAWFATHYYRKSRYIHSFIKEVQRTGVEQHEKTLVKIDTNDDIINRFVENMVVLLKIAFEAEKKGLVFQTDDEFNDIIDNIASEEFWIALERYLNEKHNNVIDKVIEQHPKLKEKDLKFIEMLCCGFSYLEIAITLGYAPNYISRKRLNLANKLNLSIPLQDYLDGLMRG